MTNPFASTDATEQARLVHSGEISAVELCRAAIDAADAVNGELNAIIRPRFEAALEAAATLDAARSGGTVDDASLPLAGVPIAIKDLDGTLAGEPYFAGTRHLRDLHYVAPVTSWLFEALQRAGAIIIATTNTPELGLVPTTEPETYGPSHNPWKLEHSTGGSSGGSAAAVAAGIVALAHAGDGGGSIRIPASECGLVGLKPSRGRVSLGPAETEAWGGLVARLAVTRTVRDTAAVLDVVSGPRPGDPYGAPGASGPYAAPVGVDPGQLRVGFTTATGDGTVVDPEIVAAVHTAAALLESLGHEVVEEAPRELADPEFVGRLTSDFLSAYPVWIAQSLDAISEMSGVTVGEAGVEAGTWALAESGRAVDAVTFANALTGLQSLSREVSRWWDGGFDVLITPTIPELPPTLGQFGSTNENPLSGVFRASPIVGLTIPFNVTGQPAISLPMAMSASGLPIGIQFVGAYGNDELLIRLAAQIEAAAPWAQRRPAVYAG